MLNNNSSSKLDIEKQIIESTKKRYLEAADKANKSFCHDAELYSIIARNLSLTDKNLPNIGITFYNKIIDLSKQFEKKGSSLYLRKPMDIYFLSNPNPSIIGVSIIDDLISISNSGIYCLNDLINDYTKTVEEKKKENKKFFVKLKKKIKGKKTDIVVFDSNEVEILRKYTVEYRSFNDQIFNYNLESHLSHTVAKHLLQSYTKVDAFTFGLSLNAVKFELGQLGYGNMYQSVINDLSKLLILSNLNIKT